MCGVLGVQLLNGERADRALLNTMIGQPHHRGSDATGIYIDGPVGLAHARLSIIDLSGGSNRCTMKLTPYGLLLTVKSSITLN